MQAFCNICSDFDTEKIGFIINFTHYSPENFSYFAKTLVYHLLLLFIIFPSNCHASFFIFCQFPKKQKQRQVYFSEILPPD